MKKVITFGVFDYFHYGHLRLIQNSKNFGDYLIVAVQKSEDILKTKPNAKIIYSTEQRVEMVSAIKGVDQVVLYGKVDDDIKTFDFDVFVVGEDQNHDGFKRAEKWCEENGKEVVYLKRTKGISSTDLKKQIKNLQQIKS